MSITVLERSNSRPLMADPKGSSATREYWARSTDVAEDALEINNAVALEAPDAYLGLIKKSIKSEPQGGGFWYAKVEYGPVEGGELEGQGGPDAPAPPPEMQPGDLLGNEFSFSTTGGTSHIVQSINTILSVSKNNVPIPDTQRAIGTSEGKVEGCDVIAPKFEFSITKRAAFLAMRKVRDLVDATGTVNAYDWNTFKAGEVLFLGAEGKFDGDGIADFSWLITYKFAIAKNLQGIQITNGLIVAAKSGWDYLWVGFTDEADTTANVLIKRPVYAFVEQVYLYTNFREALGF